MLQLFLFISLCGNLATCGSPSPESAVKEYVSGLQDDHLEKFWPYATRYNLELETSLGRIPKGSWDNEKQRIRTQWANHISADRQSTQTSTATWALIRPGADVQVTEVRAEQSGIDSWKAFLAISYAAEEASPRVYFRDGVRRLKVATAALNVTRDTGPGTPLRIADGISLLNETVVVWPVPPLSNAAALQLAKKVINEGNQPWVELDRWPAWNLRATALFNTTPLQESASAVASIKQILGEYGAILKNLHTYSGYYEVDEVVPPQGWSKYALSTRSSAWGRYPLPVYALTEQLTWDIVSISQPREDQALAEVRITYSGCTPICSMVKEFWALPEWIGRLVFRNYTGHEWAMANSSRVFYQWHIDDGWKATGAQ